MQTFGGKSTDMISIAEIFDTWVAEKLEGYRPRPGQIAMSENVAASIASGKHLLVEGVTGTGKGQAYLIPSALYAMEGFGPVVVVTANITLQEQLINKDLPSVREILKGRMYKDKPLPELEFSLMKGVGNYLCQSKLDSMLESYENYPRWLADILAWSQKTETGDKSDMDVEYPQSQWSEVCCKTDECIKESCEYKRAGKCFLYNARKEDNPPHIIVTNYHYLYSDFVVRSGTEEFVKLLPDHEVLVMDEAHEAVDIARDFMGFQVNRRSVGWALANLSSLSNIGGVSVKIRAGEAADLFFAEIGARREKIIDRPLGPDFGLIQALKDAAGVYMKAARNLEKNISGTSGKTAGAMRVQQKKWTARSKKCREHAATIEVACLGLDGELPGGLVYYTEKGAAGDSSLCGKMIDVQGFFREEILDSKTLVATSATLATNNNFDFVADQFGLEPSEYSSMITPTPFDSSRVLAVVPDHPFPDPRDRGWSDEVANVVQEIAHKIGGRTMLLCTSYRNMREVRSKLRLPGFDILMQGELPKSKIIDRFKKADGQNAVILATASFWQGVDIPGKALSCLVIDKLPFIPPDDPVLHHMNKHLGSRSFFEYSIPRALISMKQGVGRLIRSETDYGAAVVLDVRINTKGYGQQFMSAFPRDCYESPDIGDVFHFLKGFEGSDEGDQISG